MSAAAFFLTHWLTVPRTESAVAIEHSQVVDQSQYLQV